MIGRACSASWLLYCGATKVGQWVTGFWRPMGCWREWWQPHRTDQAETWCERMESLGMAWSPGLKKLQVAGRGDQGGPTPPLAVSRRLWCRRRGLAPLSSAQ